MASPTGMSGGVEAMIKEFLDDPANKEMLEEAREAAREADKQVFGNNSAIELRDLRRRVKQTCSLIATNGQIKEHPGTNWAAHLESRTIFWRPTHPFPPFGNLTSDEVLFLCAHEASHLNFSGNYDAKPEDVDQANNKDVTQFHRFVNAVEDIRCDRLSANEFPGFWPIGVNSVKKAYNEWAKMDPEGWSLADQVGLNFIWLAHGLAPLGTDDAKRISLQAWPEMSRVGNAASTQEVADGIVELYKQLRDQDPSSIDGGQSFSNGIGADSPTGQPVRSQGGTYGPMNQTEVLDGMAKDAQPGAAQALGKAKQEANSAENNAGHAVDTQLGETAPKTPEELDKKLSEDANYNSNPVGAEDAMARASGGEGSGIGRGRGGRVDGWNAWDRKKEQMRGDINALHNRLRAILRSNAMDTYESGKRRGMLDSKRAYRAYAGNPRIFRKRSTVGDLDYTFGILIDISGSMNGSNMDNAFSTVVLVAEAMDKLGLGIFVLPWDDGPAHLKPVDEPLGRHKGDLGCYLARARGGTYEAPALCIAQEEMAKVKSGTKMLFVISDGGTSRIDESRQLAKEIQGSDVRVVAIGINFDPAAHYENKIRVNSASELTSVLPKLINEVVKRGHH